jgi:hypothetical protein
MAHTQADQRKQDAKAAEEKERSDREHAGEEPSGITREQAALERGEGGDEAARQRKEAELKSLDDSEVQHVFVSKGHGERVTVIVRYHPPTRDSGGIKAGELRPGVKKLVAELQKRADEAMKDTETETGTETPPAE